MSEPTFWEYRLTADLLCIGERLKKGTYRPCVRTIPCATVEGALRAAFGTERAFYAAGYFVNDPPAEHLVAAPRDTAVGVSKLPLTVEVLVRPEGRVFVLANDGSADLPESFALVLGSRKSQGIGRCELTRLEERKPEVRRGVLRTRLYDDPDHRAAFGVEAVHRPRFGYLFRPTSSTSGVYVLSLLEGSEVEAYDFLLE
jgi:hypothetical protein